MFVDCLSEAIRDSAMFSISQRARAGAFCAIMAGAALSGCATPAPTLKGDSSYVVESIKIDAGDGEGAFASALRSAVGAYSGMSGIAASADVEISVYRENSPFLGLFYGGPDHAALSVTLRDDAGRKLDSFPINVGTESGAGAEGELAAKAAAIIAARAASAFMPIAAMPKAALKLAVATVVEAPIVEAPVATPPSDVPCVIGPDGKCLPL
jgi:hypothetical protein